MSGLDPVGRKEVRDLIVEEKRAGRTVFFSSHILSDVEMLCDRVCILRKGEVVVSGKMSELLSAKVRRSEIALREVSDETRNALTTLGFTPRALGDTSVIDVEGDALVQQVLERALATGAKVESITPRRETLEDLF